ncbi:hydrophobic surface binding protein [Crassisporium funariophilum]|nr:hydrophobic surface binding protein [Crassisporium funariophilum]
MVHFTAPLVLLFSFASIGFSTPVKRTVDQVKADIADISAKVTALNDKITAFPLTGGTLANALGIHNSAVALVTTLQTATTDVTNTGPVDVTDGTVILDSVQAFEPTIQHALTEIVVKKPAFQALPIGGLPALILQDLNNLKTGTVAFSNALIAAAPPSLVAEATSLRDGIVAGFDTAIAAYA